MFNVHENTNLHPKKTCGKIKKAGLPTSFSLHKRRAFRLRNFKFAGLVYHGELRKIKPLKLQNAMSSEELGGFFMAKTATGRRTRNYATVVYPESAPQNWQEILSEQLVPAFISPLHEFDKNPTGEPKKPHHHVLLVFDSVKTVEQAQEIFSQIGGVGCEVVQSLRGYARYLCHLDNPEKAQYQPEDVRCLCGADYMATIGLVLDKYKAVREMVYFCRDNDILSYADLLEYCCEERPDWFRVLCDNGTVVVKEYLKSKSWDKRMRE